MGSQPSNIALKKIMLTRLVRFTLARGITRKYHLAGPGNNNSWWELSMKTAKHGAEWYALAGYCVWVAFTMVAHTVYNTTIKKVEVTPVIFDAHGSNSSKDYNASNAGIDWTCPTDQRTFNHVKDGFWKASSWKDELKELLAEIHSA